MSTKIEINTQQALRIVKSMQEEILEEVSEGMLKEIKRGTPTMSGKLKDGYSIDTFGGKVELKSEEIYWEHVEFGTSRQSAQPHISPVMNDRGLIDKLVKKVVDKYDKGGY